MSDRFKPVKEKQKQWAIFDFRHKVLVGGFVASLPNAPRIHWIWPSKKSAMHWISEYQRAMRGNK